MPFIRYSRDKRGYESTVVMHAYRGGQGPPRTRVLYLFRSPSSIKVGRHGLDPEVMEALEHTHPDLAFDWPGLLREPAARVDVPDRPERQERQERWRGRSEPRPPAAPEPAPPVIVEDESILGRALGAREAAMVRARYNEVLQRIARRARTPEERDRLTDRAVRLNPDDWPDEAAVRASVAAAHTEWEAILTELPHRRRGRRGGRARNDDSPAPAPESPGSRAESAIIEDEGLIHERSEEVLEAGTAGQDSDAGDVGDSRGLGTDAGPAADPSTDATARDSAIPGGGQRDHD